MMVDINDFEQEKTCTYKEEFYKVRDNGAVLRMTPEGKKARPLDNTWTFGKKNDSSGYMTIGEHRVHIIVATAFYGAKDSKVYVVDHIDTNRCNNRVENLRWLTKLENVLLNENTRQKIEFICGSVEEFLQNPSLLRGHEYSDKNFEWMRTVTKEEAENTLKSWKMLMEKPRMKPLTREPIGDWIFKKNRNASSHDLPHVKTIKQIQDDNLHTNTRVGIIRPQENPPKDGQKHREKKERNKYLNAMMSDRLMEEDIFVDKVKVRFVKESCYWCNTDHYVYILIGAISDKFPALASTGVFLDYGNDLNEFDPVVINGVKRFLSMHPELNYNMGDIKKRYSRTKDEEYDSFGCPKCDGMVGDWYLNETRLEYLYEPDDENVHVIELEEPMKLEYKYK